MYIWVFKPSENWHYCGGGLVIIAESFEECQELAKELPPVWSEPIGLYTLEEEIPKDRGEGIWILVDNFLLSLQYKSRIVWHDYNWG